MSEVVSSHEQALLRITAGPKRWKRVGSILKADPRFLAERWLEELAKRRCVWCWNLLDPEVEGSVYDLIANILPESGPVYDLTAIDRQREFCR
jgi:hypothetical protein